MDNRLLACVAGFLHSRPSSIPAFGRCSVMGYPPREKIAEERTVEYHDAT